MLGARIKHNQTASHLPVCGPIHNEKLQHSREPHFILLTRDVHACSTQSAKHVSERRLITNARSHKRNEGKSKNARSGVAIAFHVHFALTLFEEARRRVHGKVTTFAVHNKKANMGVDCGD